MAIYHLSVKTISRSAGRSATAAAAYRAGAEIVDERTGEVHDYRRKSGVESAHLILPTDAPEWASERAKLWNAAEVSETRKNSTVAREFEIALPSELSPDERRRLAHDFARELVARHGCAADVAIHAPGREGDNRNHHAHILCTTRRLTPDGFGAKCRELDDRKTGEVDRWRERFAVLQNDRLERAGVAERVDHRSLKDQGIDREPTQHLGPTASGYERRTGQPSDKRINQELDAAERLIKAKQAGELERVGHQLDRTILDLSGDLAAAVAERSRLQKQAMKEMLEREKQRNAEMERKKPLTLETATLLRSRWDAALQDERALYLKELTEQARLRAAATVAAFQRHIDAGKPLLFGRQKWEDRLQSFETREHLDRMVWEELRDGHYPRLDNDKKAVQEAVEQRVSDKNPELAQRVPEATAIVHAERVRLEQEMLTQLKQDREARQKSAGKDAQR